MGVYSEVGMLPTTLPSLGFPLEPFPVLFQASFFFGSWHVDPMGQVQFHKLSQCLGIDRFPIRSKQSANSGQSLNLARNAVG